MAATFIGAANDPATGDGQVSSRAVQKPAGAQVAVFSVMLWIGPGDPTITPPSGAVLRNSTVATETRTATYLKYVSGDATGTTYTFSFSSSTWSALKAIFFDGVDTGLDLATVPFNAASANGANYASVSVTTVIDAALAWGGNAAEGSGVTHTPPTNFTETHDATWSTAAYRISPGTGSQAASGASTSSAIQHKVSTLVALAAAATGVTGSLSETQDNQTLAASGTAGAIGSVSETQADQALAASGTLGISGSLTETQADQTLSASGTVGETVTGSLAETQEDQTLSASGQLGYTGTLTETQDAHTLAASGTVGDVTVGSLTETQDDNTLSASGQVVHTGTLAVTQDDQTATATGWAEAAGSLQKVQDDHTLIASGQLGHTGTLAQTQDAQNVAADGWVEAVGALAVTQADHTMSAAGFVGELAESIATAQGRFQATDTAPGGIGIFTLAAVPGNSADGTYTSIVTADGSS